MGFASDIKAMADVQRIKKGGTAKLSISQITTLVVNMPDARRNLSELEFSLVYALYKQLRRYKTKKEMDFDEYLSTAAKIVMEFNKIASYEKYGGNSQGELRLFMEELNSLWPFMNDGEPLQDFKGDAKSRKSVPLSAFIFMVLVFAAACAVLIVTINEIRETTYEAAYAEGYDVGFNKGKNLRSEQLDELRETVRQKEDTILEMKPEYNFFHEYASIVTTAAGAKYHHYGCKHIEGRTFYIYNIELAKYYGYTPCEDCWGAMKG